MSNKYYKKKVYTKVCPVCKKEFEIDHSARVYCSESCRMASYYQKKKKHGVGKPKKRTGNVYQRKHPDQLCWSCQKACGGCSWSKSFIPIEGWKAKLTKIKCSPTEPYCESYLITACPEYIKDEKR